VLTVSELVVSADQEEAADRAILMQRRIERISATAAVGLRIDRRLPVERVRNGAVNQQTVGSA
jgi:hypothetical protein